MKKERNKIFKLLKKIDDLCGDIISPPMFFSPLGIGCHGQSTLSLALVFFAFSQLVFHNCSIKKGLV